VEFEHFPNAPIQEALIDFRTSFLSLPSEESFAGLHLRLASRYPKRTALTRHVTQLTVDEKSDNVARSKSFAGFLYSFEEVGLVFQARFDGFTLSQLKPYRSWQDLISEAKIVWSAYVDSLKPVTIDRIACRYINRFEVSNSEFDLGEYLMKPPELPPQLPQGLSKFLLQFELPVPAAKCTALVTQALERASERSASFLLDIDVFRAVSYASSQAQHWDDLEKLRDVKNQIFFTSLTEKSLDLFR
jgi:uncharacterized protein (TIGR04255 family)